MNWMKSNSNFLTRLCSFLLVLLALGIYQQRALCWAEEQKENQEQIAEVEAYNAEVLAQQKALEQAQETAEPETISQYIDGTYTGSGEGFGGEIAVEVTISDDTITDISIASAEGEDSAYLSVGKQIIDSILQAQSADVDTITGATFSSAGIRTAVADALKKAVNPNG